MKKLIIIAIVSLFVSIALSSCKSSKCPAYSNNDTEQLEERV